jgi:nanoRNase/pAp phosphatase (c-di-AMP/oligoRNAs hydrolase)
MALEPIQQFEKLLEQAKNALVFLPQNPSGDAIGAGWAFYFFLKKKEIEATLAFSSDNGDAQKFQFLPRPEKIVHKISGARDFVLAFNTQYNKIMNVRTETKEEELRIYITPEHGAIDPRDFSFIPAKFKFDAIFVFGSPDKESLGKIYEENPDLLFEVPVVNIDHHSNNDNFGQINLVNITASSTSEALAQILEKIDPFSVDAKIAECLLAGIMGATESFQKKNTTPKALQMAATLMDKGADQQKIVRYLYKTQPFHLLKLWGRIMARLKWDEKLKMVWAPVFLEDFVQSRSNPKELPFILEKIKDNYSNGRLFLVFYDETPQIISGMVKCAWPEDAGKVAALLDGQISQDVVKFNIPEKNMADAEKEIIDKISKII